MQRKNYSLNGHNIILEVPEEVFMPTDMGAGFFAKNIKVNQGESVVDVGTGSGVLAILSSFYSDEVYGTDISERSIETARRNARLNGKSIDFRVGGFFADLDGTYDVIIANLPQELTDYPIFDGGDNGNSILMRFLGMAQDYMTQDTRIYTVVYTLSRYWETLEFMTRNFNTKLLNFSRTGVKDFVPQNIGFYRKANRRGDIMIVEGNGNIVAHEYLVELSKR